MLLFDPEELARTFAALHRSGWQIAAHAIGDRAVDLAIDHLVRAQTAHPRSDPRHRIEHCGIASDTAVARMAEAGIVPVPQGSFIRELGDGFLTALGDERAAHAYRVRSFLDRRGRGAGELRRARRQRGPPRGDPLPRRPAHRLREAARSGRGDHRRAGGARVHARLRLRGARGDPQGTARSPGCSRTSRSSTGTSSPPRQRSGRPPASRPRWSRAHPCTAPISCSE